ncbi:MAG: carbohydrate ABC transporter permease [Chloroflexia bacterium]|nr:carbohydrate ABC transporter permease [Chloroflexia bacterium]
MPGSRWRLAVALPLAVAFLFPLFWLVSTSLQPTGQPLSRRLNPWPAAPAWENYAAVFGVVEFARFGLNSLLVVLVAVPLTVLVSSWAGFALARLPARPRRLLVALSFVVLMTPVTAVWLPRFLLFEAAGLIDNRLALVVPAFAGTSPLYALLFLWSCRRIPADLFEAAALDGAGPFRLWANVAMPLSRPTAVAVATLAFVASWGNFIDPLLYIRSAEKQTLPYGLQFLFQLDSTNWPVLMAAAAMATAPAVLAFLAAQRLFLQPFRGGGWLGR